MFVSRLLRPLPTIVLCVIATFGHAPVWLHVATCHNAASGDMAEASASSCSCCHSTFSPPADELPPGDLPGQDRSQSGEHDSGHCPICQTLASPTGFVAVAMPQLFVQVWSQVTVAVALDLVEQPHHLLQPVRGPPAIAC